MKIAFIGTHGVGKTTLCYDLAGILKRQGLHVDMVMKSYDLLFKVPMAGAAAADGVRDTDLDESRGILWTAHKEESSP